MKERIQMENAINLMMEAFHINHFGLYGLLKEGLDDVAEGSTKPFSEAISEIRSRRKR